MNHHHYHYNLWLSYDKHGNGVSTPKQLYHLISTSVRDATIDELNQYNTFLVPAPSTPVVATHNILTPKRPRTPAKKVHAPVQRVATARQLVLMKQKDEKKKKEVIITSDDDVEEVEPPPKKKKTPTKVKVTAKPAAAAATSVVRQRPIISSPPPRLPIPQCTTPAAPATTPEQNISLLQSLISSVPNPNNDFSSLVPPPPTHAPHHIPRYPSLTSYLFNTLRDARNRQEIDAHMHALQHQFEVQSNQLDWFRTCSI